VAVGVLVSTVAVGVGVRVGGRGLGVNVAVFVGVSVGVLVGRRVGVIVGVSVGGAPVNCGSTRSFVSGVEVGRESVAVAEDVADAIDDVVAPIKTALVAVGVGVPVDDGRPLAKVTMPPISTSSTSANGAARRINVSRAKKRERICGRRRVPLTSVT